MTGAPAAGARPPDSRSAMLWLIDQVRHTIPFGHPVVCTGACQGCSVKLLEYLDGELAAWEQHVNAGGRVGLAELSRLARTARKVHAVLVRNGLIAETG